MSKKKPFQNLKKEEIQNLGLIALAALYLAFFVANIYGNDYMALWSGGHIANTQGYAAVYDMASVEKVQRAMLGMDDPSIDFSPLPLPYLPIFMLPMQALAWLPLMTGFWVWRLANLALALIYMRFLLSKISPGLSKRTLALLMLAFPVFLNISEGQINAWLLVFVGEFLRTDHEQRHFQSGLWLGGLLLKPQTLVIILPALFLQRLWRTLSGFSLSAAFLAFISLALAGQAGISGIFKLWLNFTDGISGSSPENMVNWRMLGIHIENWMTPTWGASVTYVGMLLSVSWVFLIWYRWNPSQSRSALMLGTLAATLIVTWHSHIHMGMILIPAIAYGLASSEISNRVFNTWLFLLPCTLLVVLLFGLITNTPEVLMPGELGSFVLGLSGLLINLMLMVNTAKYLRPLRVK